MANANTWLTKLKLEPHPEGGYFKEVYRSGEMIPNEGLPQRYNGSRNFATSIYYLLKSGQFSAFHKLQSDEIWNFYDGSSLTLHLLHEDAAYESIILGRDIEQKQILQFVIPKGVWFAAEVNEGNSFSLVGCQVAPGFDFDDFELGDEQNLKAKFPDYENLINKFTH